MNFRRTSTGSVLSRTGSMIWVCRRCLVADSCLRTRPVGKTCNPWSCFRTSSGESNFSGITTYWDARCNWTGKTTRSSAWRRRVSRGTARMSTSAETDPGSPAHLYSQSAIEAGRDARSGERRTATSAGTVRQGHAKAFSRALQGAGGRPERVGSQAYRRNLVSDVRCSDAFARDRVWKRFDPAAGAPPWEQLAAALCATSYGIAVVGRGRRSTGRFDFGAAVLRP